MAEVRPDPQLATTAGVLSDKSCTPTRAKICFSSSCRVAIESGLARVRLHSTNPRTQGAVRSQQISEGHAARACRGVHDSA